MVWTRDARELLEKAPPFIVKFAAAAAEKEARKRGLAAVSVELVRELADAGSPRKRGGAEPFRLAECFAAETENPLYGSFPAATLTNNHSSKLDAGLPREQYEAVWEEAVSHAPRHGRRALYVHTPFCSTHCRYCGFFVNGSAPGVLDRYTDYLVRELEMMRGKAAVAEYPVNCVYFGGGTPSDLSAANLERILKTLRSFNLAADCEITLEGRVSSLTPEKVRVCSDYGVNRYSLGVQTFRTELRRSMGRISDRGEVISALRSLAESNHAAVVIDLIYGLPGQTMRMWEEDLRTLFEECPVSGVDHYPLILMPGTPLARAVKAGTLPPAPDAAERADMFLRGVELMESNHARRISLKHFALDERERNCYNRLQAFNGCCFPAGCGGGGTVNGFFFYQGGTLERYYEMVDGKRKPLTQVSAAGPDAEVLNRIDGGIRIDCGFHPGRIGRAAGFTECDLAALFRPLLGQYEARGLVKTDDDGWVNLTPAGQFWHNAIIENLKHLFLHRRELEGAE
ncbi:MAG: heme anaerobic degradation radical SAM methyltransferase ChuW/HutW [Lentisphaeria bacterium]|nr:heme anaerobic degradation radical SAM methyltransferase ChuW/HutW [Lentisphaeria bacterium]